LSARALTVAGRRVALCVVCALSLLLPAPPVVAQDAVFADGFEPRGGTGPLPDPSGPQWWVSPLGADAPGNGSAASPLRTLAYACTRAMDGDAIRLVAGEFQETAQCVPRSGVRIMGAGAAVTRVLAPLAWDFRPDGTTDAAAGYVVRIEGVQRVTVDRLAFAGNGHRANGAIRVRNARQVTLRDLAVADFRYIGVNLGDSSGLDVQNLSLRNAGLEWPPGASSEFPAGGSLGNLGVFGVSDALFQWIDIRTDGLFGYGIKAANLTRVRFAHMDLDMHPFQSWNGVGPNNFDIEIHGGFADRVEIAHNTFRQTISLMGGNDPRYAAQPYSIHVHHNLFDMKNGSYSVEVGTDRMVFDHNWFRNTWTALQNYGDANTRIGDLTVFNNVVENVSMRFVGLKGRVENLRVFNNTVYLGPGGGQSYLVTLGSNNGSRNWHLANNAVLGAAGNPAASRAFVVSYQGSSAPREVRVRNNVYRDLALAVNLGDVAVDPVAWEHQYGGNLAADPGLPASGAARLQPVAGSAVVDRGDVAYGLPAAFNGAARDVGAFELGAPAWSSGRGSSSSVDYLWAPTSSVRGPCFVDSVDLDFAAAPGASIRYTLDGSEPGPASPLYTAPVRLTQAAKVRARAFRNGTGSATTLFLDLCRGVQGFPNLAEGSIPSASSNFPDIAYSPQRAIDGVTYSWQGWASSANDPQAWLQLDLGTPARLRYLELFTRGVIDDPATRRNFEIRASNDPGFGSFVVLHAQGATPLPFEGVLEREVVDPTPYRYVRATKTAAEFFFITELRVRGER
jgi:hypothetical protein